MYDLSIVNVEAALEKLLTIHEIPLDQDAVYKSLGIMAAISALNEILKSGIKEAGKGLVQGHIDNMCRKYFNPNVSAMIGVEVGDDEVKIFVKHKEGRS